MLEYFFGNEKERSKHILKNGFTNKQFTPHEAQLVAKHCFLNLGYGEIKTRKFLISFCENNDKEFNYILYRHKFKTILKNANTDWKDNSEPVIITKSELEKIRKIKNFTAQKIMFVVLVFSKRTHGYVYDNQLADIKKLLGISIVENEMKRLLYLAYKEGLIRDSNENFFIKLNEPESEALITISTYKELYNLEKIYKDYCGGELFFCKVKDCGEEFIRRGRRHIYCEKHKEYFNKMSYIKYNKKRIFKNRTA